MSELWTCPYCNRNCTIGDTEIRTIQTYTYVSEEYGYYYSILEIIVCPNPKCRQQTISLDVFEYNPTNHQFGKKVYS
jgi:hypothetical protein